MSKPPAFQFYPSDWVRDTKVLSLAAKGAWADLLCAMWWSQNRGSLTLPAIGYARLLGTTLDQAVVVINELLDLAICDGFYDEERTKRCTKLNVSVTSALHVTQSNEKVTLVCRRMDREEKERKSTAYRVQRFRNAKSNANVTVASSTSTSSSCNARVTRVTPPISPKGGNAPVTAAVQKRNRSKTTAAYSVGFSAFWAAYPKKVAPDKAWESWQKKGLEPIADEIVKKLSEQKTWNQWTDDGGRYIPHPSTYLNQGRWKDEPLAPPTRASPPRTNKTDVLADMMREAEEKTNGHGTGNHAMPGDPNRQLPGVAERPATGEPAADVQRVRSAPG